MNLATVNGKAWKNNKFRNRPVRDPDDGFFHSAGEHRRWHVLKLMEKDGKIRGLERQVRFDIVINGVKIGFWKADFAYFRDQSRIIEDFKSAATAEDKYWRFKKKVLEAVFGFQIHEVF